MRRKLGLLTAGVGFSCLLVPVAAHHSWTAEYDPKKPVAVTGVVTKIEWTNPHIHVYVDVADEKGVATNWNFEMASPNHVERNGWSRKTLTPGTEVTVKGFGGRAVTARAVLNTITLADGRSLFAALDNPGR
jgi:hypothetical protein